MSNRLRLPALLLLFGCVLICSCKGKTATDHRREFENEAARRQHEALLKYKNSDYQTAKSALVDVLQFLDKLGYPPNAPDEFRTDAMLICLRLAKLEEKNHGSEQAAYMKQAVTRCQTFKYMKCDENSLRKEIDRLDLLIK